MVFKESFWDEIRQSFKQILGEIDGHRNCIPSTGIERTESWREEVLSILGELRWCFARGQRAKGNVVGSKDGLDFQCLLD